MGEQREIVAGLRERYERVVVEDKGDIFNSDLTQAIELGYLLELARACSSPALARKESRGAHARPHDFPSATTRTSCGTPSRRWVNGAPRLDWKPVTMTKWQPHEMDVLTWRSPEIARAPGSTTMDVELKIWRFDRRRASAS